MTYVQGSPDYGYEGWMGSDVAAMLPYLDIVVTSGCERPTTLLTSPAPLPRFLDLSRLSRDRAALHRRGDRPYQAAGRGRLLGPGQQHAAVPDLVPRDYPAGSSRLGGRRTLSCHQLSLPSRAVSLPFSAAVLNPETHRSRLACRCTSWCLASTGVSETAP